MLVPNIVADNFFDDCDDIIKIANSLPYKPDPEGKWPGVRSEPLESVNRVLWTKVCKKVISLMYPTDNYDMSWDGTFTFQKIKMNKKEKEFTEGWVHHDHPYLFTVMIYLSDHTDVGTSIALPKSITSYVKHVPIKNMRNRTGKAPQFREKLLDNNGQFEESIRVNSKKNRVFIFDSSQYHFAHNMVSKQDKGDRLTLVGFFNDLKLGKGMRWGIPEMKKNQEM